MKLYLVQHGLAMSKQEHPDRPLSEQGIREVNNLARFLADACIELTTLYHSGKLRAQQTAEIIQHHLKTKEVKTLEGIAPNDPVDPVCTYLNSLTANILIVGHLPFLSKLTSSLVCNDTTDVVRYQPGTIVCLEKKEDQWKISWMLCPELLRQ